MKAEKKNSYNDHYLINELADRLEVSIRTIKTWEDKELIPKARRNKVGWRIYNENELKETIKIVERNNYFVPKVQK